MTLCVLLPLFASLSAAVHSVPDEGGRTSANAELIGRFYQSLQKRDADGMATCYHPDVTFSDPVFQNLHGSQATNMWRMLCERGTDLVVEFRDVQGDESSGTAHWEAWYTFATTGRKVHNVIDAAFTFQDGKIVRHEDSFDLSAWASQALGLPGKLFGRTAFLQKKIRAMAMKGLADFARKAT